LESRLQEKMCENLNAEIASGTIGSVVEAVGYLSWTFFARRMKTNPSYYGADSGSDEDVDMALLAVVKGSLSELAKSGCIEYNERDSTTENISPSPLGKASCNYYLLHETPKQMQSGVRECRKVLLAELETGDHERPKALSSSKSISFDRSKRVDELSLAWLLYTLCNTHEFDELPVRHNEDSLNEELSKKVVWGADTQKLLSGKAAYHGPDLFADPHTKAFLLLQASIARVRFPISDYVNDAKSVVENVPRLLSAMEYIAAADTTAAGSFELLTQFARSRQYIESKSLPGDNPLSQIGLPAQVAERLEQEATGKKNAVRDIARLRSLPRKDARVLLNKLDQKNRLNGIEPMLDRLYSIPAFSVQEAKVVIDVNKTTGKSTGRLKVAINLERSRSKKQYRDSDSSYTMSLLVGSYQRRQLLGKSSMRMSRSGSWNATREISFDWNAANADAGQDGGVIVLRLLVNEARGFDLEMIVALQ
jgi:hypothetical protein